MFLTKESDPPTIGFWRDNVFEPVQGILGTIARKRSMVALGKTPPPDREEIDRIRAYVPCGVYCDYDGRRHGVLGVAEHTETRELFAVILTSYGQPELVPVLEFLRPENSSKGDRHRLGIRYRLVEARMPRDLLCFAWRGNEGPSPGYATLWKDPTNRYAVHGQVEIVRAAGVNRESAMLYTPLYPPHEGTLVVRPMATVDGSAGFFDPVMNRMTRAGEPYEGKRFIFDDNPTPREVLFEHIRTQYH